MFVFLYIPQIDVISFLRANAVKPEDSSISRPFMEFVCLSNGDYYWHSHGDVMFDIYMHMCMRPSKDNVVDIHAQMQTLHTKDRDFTHKLWVRASAPHA